MMRHLYHRIGKRDIGDRNFSFMISVVTDLGVGILLHELDVGGHHFFDEIDESDFRTPSQNTLRLGRVAQQKLHFGRTIKLGIHLRENSILSRVLD